MPSTRAKAGAAVTSLPAGRLAAASTSEVYKAPISGRPVVLPKVRERAISPEATPSRSRGTEPMMALLLGDWNMPIPAPKGISRSMKPIAVVSTLSVAMPKQPPMIINSPIRLMLREPKRSESDPAMGATMPMVSGLAIMIRPTCAVLKPLTSCRKNGMMNMPAMVINTSTAISRLMLNSELRNMRRSTMGCLTRVSR